MSHRGRPHNFGQALFEGLGAGLGAFGSFLEQERVRKSESTQQSFLNDLRTAEAGRSQERLGLERDRIGIAEEGLGLRQDDFQRQKQVDLFNAMQKLTIDPIEQSGIDLRGAQQGAAEALEAQRRGAGGGVTASTFNTIFGELGQGFKQRELRRQLDAQNPSFGTMRPSEFNLFSANTPARFEPRQDISLDEIAIPGDTLTALLQQARQIAGGAPPLTPATDLSKLGAEQIFPDIDIDEGLPTRDLAEAEGLARQWAESGGISDWANLQEATRRQIIEKLLQEGVPGANR